jgi:hypothetical protein
MFQMLSMLKGLNNGPERRDNHSRPKLEILETWSAHFGYHYQAGHL